MRHDRPPGKTGRAPSNVTGQPSIAVARAKPGDAAAAARLIEAAFARDIAPAMSSVGRVAFRLYVTEKALRLRLAQGAVAWCARAARPDGEPTLLGYAELRGRDGSVDGIDHLSLLFVAVDRRGHGIARRLLVTVCRHLRQAQPPVDELTVQAAPGAVPVYERLGFRRQEMAERFMAQPGMPCAMRLQLAGHRHPFGPDHGP